MSQPAWTWLYTRGRESVRIAIEHNRLIVFGPGAEEYVRDCRDEDDARLQQKLVEQRLILQGWTLDTLIAERRSGADRREADRGATDRRRTASTD